MSTNLPPASDPGVFSILITRDIEAPVETVWDVLTDFPSYGDW